MERSKGNEEKEYKWPREEELKEKEFEEISRVIKKF